MEAFDTNEYHVTLFGHGNRIVFIPEKAGSAERISEMVGQDIVIAALDGVDWNNDLTPWRAPGLRSGEFGDGAEKFLRALTGDVIPMTLERLSVEEYELYLAGYSLAGLFAVWAATRTDIFAGVASVSGSLWYDGFIDYLTGARLLVPEIYFSVGEAESRTRSQRLAGVVDMTSTAYNIAKGQKIDTTMRLNPGGHFSEPEKRCADAVRWLTGDKATKRKDDYRWKA